MRQRRAFSPGEERCLRISWTRFQPGSLWKRHTRAKLSRTKVSAMRQLPSVFLNQVLGQRIIPVEKTAGGFNGVFGSRGDEDAFRILTDLDLSSRLDAVFIPNLLGAEGLAFW